MDHVTHMLDNRLREQQASSDADWIAERVERLFGRFKRDIWTDPHEAFRTIVANLAKYPKEVIEYVTGETTGLHTKLDWSPSIHGIIDACREHHEYLKRIERSQDLGYPVQRTLPRPRWSTDDNYTVMTERYPGRVYGPFDDGRQFPYRG